MNEAYGLFGKPPDFASSGDCDFDGSLGPYTAGGEFWNRFAAEHFVC